MSIGKNIKNARINANLSQKELAELLQQNNIEVGNTTISNWEHETSKPDIEIIRVLCKILNVDANSLLDLDKRKKELELNNENDEKYKKILRDKGLMDENENISPENFEKLMDFAVANKDFIINKKDKN